MAGLPGAQADELQLFEVLMLVCEQLGCPEGAARFALAAVHEARIGCGTLVCLLLMAGVDCGSGEVDGCASRNTRTRLAGCGRHSMCRHSWCAQQ